jgi:hypothetical protein
VRSGRDGDRFRVVVRHEGYLPHFAPTVFTVLYVAVVGVGNEQIRFMNRWIKSVSAGCMLTMVKG